MVKKLLSAKKAGHTGSLDPIATGLLPLCFGNSTKVTSLFLNSDKCYDVEIRLGVSTDSGDREGVATNRCEVDVSTEQIEQALQRFRGIIKQVPPMFSALKKNGQPLYKLARKGVEVKREPREVTVHRLSLNHRIGDVINLGVSCSKGFYIRSLAMDLGNVLGCGAHVQGLRRTRVGIFDIEHAITLEQLEALDTAQTRQRLLLPTDQALSHLPKVDLPEKSAKYFCQGQAVSALPLPRLGLARLYSENKTFLGLGEVTKDGRVAPKRIFI